VGGLTNREARDLTIDLSFLSGKQMQLFKDGVNADRKGSDFKLTNERVNGRMQIHLAPGGGFAAKIQ
jgi:alpha-glucosidase